MQIVIRIKQRTARKDITLKIDKHKSSKDSKLILESGKCLYENLCKQISSIDGVDIENNDWLCCHLSPKIYMFLGKIGYFIKLYLTYFLWSYLYISCLFSRTYVLFKDNK